jgi:hypothetical protein
MLGKMFILGGMLPLEVWDLHKIRKHDYIHKYHVINFLMLS